MNKYQARCKLIAGHKITHAHFIPGQYVEQVGDRILNEEGHVMGGAPYNPYGSSPPAGATPIGGWELFEDENDGE